MTKTEKEKFTILENKYAREVLKSSNLVEENSLLKRELEILCEKYSVSDDEQNEVRKMALEGK